MHILSIAVRDNDKSDDSTLSKLFSDFCQRNKEELTEKGIRRITFLVLNK